MKAFAFEYRFRYVLHTLVYVLGFWSPWARYMPAAGFTTTSVWVAGCIVLARHGWLSFGGSVRIFLGFALILTGLGAWFRIWGAAYVGAGAVQSQYMHGSTLLADGPYRRTRNPLYLGTLLHTLGIAILMPPSGALLTIILLWVLQFRLALAEEPFLASHLGNAYEAYRARVPRFVPLFAPIVTDRGQVPHWGQAFLGEVYFVGVFLTLLIFGWGFNAAPLLRGILISLGLSLVVYAFLPRADQE